MSKLPTLVMGGRAYADIDVLACTSAYKQLLTIQGYKSHALITGPWNQTIPSSIRAWDLDVEREFPYEGQDCSFVLVDFSNPEYVDSFVNLDKVSEVFDHHYGYEEYWENKIGSKAQIESIGACATLIWEKFKHANMQDRISTVNANLLYTAIFANTLDFKSFVTQKRDIDAANELLYYTDLPKNWKEIYYQEIEEDFLKNDFNRILEDTKNIIFQSKSFRFAQIELFHAQSFLNQAENKMKIFNENKNEFWVINIISIQEGHNYLYCNCINTYKKLKHITNAHKKREMEGFDLLITPRLWLRKELLKEMIILENTQKV